MLLLEYKAESLSAGICAQSHGFIEVKVGHNWCRCDRVLDFLKCRSDQVNSFLVLSKGLNGDSRWAMVLVLDESWFTSPMKDCKAVRLDRVGKLVIARAYRPQRGRGHVTAIHDSVPSKLQIRQWFVTNYSNSCCLDCISAMD